MVELIYLYCSKHLKDYNRRIYHSREAGTKKYSEFNGDVTNGMQTTGLH